MNTRVATPLDAPTLSRLCMDVQHLHVKHYPGIFRMPENDEFAVSFFSEILANPSAHIFIVEENGNAVGYILCQLIERPENPFTFAARILHIDQISVRPEARGKGVGAALMHQAEELANKLDVDRIDLDSWDFNRSAHRFFEHNGFEKFNYRFWRTR